MKSKFCTLLTNWLMWKKMFTYFYNKVRPVNHMHYIKCAVNSSLVTLLWLLQKVCGTLDHCFIMAHSIHKEGDSQIYFCVIFCETRHHAQDHVISGTLIHRWQCSWVENFVGQCLLWDSCVSKHILRPHLVFQPIWECGSIGSFQLPQSNSSLEVA